jgi:hypothetical protein
MDCAAAIDWSHMDWAVFASTLVLALVTLGLVVFTRRLVREAVATRDEMERTRADGSRARLEAVRPRIALGVDNLGAGIGFVTVTNIGGGAATDLLGRLDLGALGQRQIAFHVMEVGEKHQYMPKSPATGEFVRMDEFTADTPIVSLRGAMMDTLGNNVQVDEEINLAEVWEITKASNRRLPPDYEKKAVDEIERIRKTLEQLHRTGQSAYYRAWPLDDADPDG